MTGVCGPHMNQSEDGLYGGDPTCDVDRHWRPPWEGHNVVRASILHDGGCEAPCVDNDISK
jgi:hypothetical protein